MLGAWVGPNHTEKPPFRNGPRPVLVPAVVTNGLHFASQSLSTRRSPRHISCEEVVRFSRPNERPCVRLLKAGTAPTFPKPDMSQLSAKDLAILSAAVSQLERPSLAGKLAAVVGMPVEKLLGWLPESIQSQIDRVTEEALAQA